MHPPTGTIGLFGCCLTCIMWQFLEFIVAQEDSQPSGESSMPLIYDTLFEMYLREDDTLTITGQAEQARIRVAKQQKALALLMNPNVCRVSSSHHRVLYPNPLLLDLHASLPGQVQ
jgi:hypothetical protein